MKKLILQQFKKTGAIAGGVSTVFGLISDLLHPIAPFSSYLFFASAFSIVVIFITMSVKSTLQEKVAPALVVSIALMIFSGALFGFQGKEDEKSGVLASKIPALQKLQSSLGVIQEDIAAIKKSAENIEKTTARTEKVIEQVEKNTKENAEATSKVAEAVQESTKQIVGSLAEMQKGFSALTQSGGVIANPTRPEQFYHNARVYELRGDYGNARRSYNRYLTFKLDFLDPHLRYQTFLKIQEGRAGAREIYSAIYENDPRPVVEFARILLFTAPKRTEMLKNFITKNPDFAPAYYELSREFSEGRKGTQSLSDKRAELKALQEFETLREGGKFFRFFVDKKLASKWISDVERRLKSLSFIIEMGDKNPVTISAMKSNSGWSVRAEISENTREIFYKLPGMKKFKSLGHLQYKNPTTGLFMPHQEFALSCPPGKKKYSLRCDLVKTKIEYKYIDMTKTERGPFTILFDGKKELDLFCRRILEQTYGNDISKLHRYPGCEYFSR